MVLGVPYREDVMLTGGLRIRFRMVAPSDQQPLAEGFARLSAESRYRRFFSARSALTVAAERGIQRIRFHLLADNERMRRLIKHLLGDAAFAHEGEVMTAEVSVPSTNDPKKVSQDERIAPFFDLLRLLAAGSVTSVNIRIASVRLESVAKDDNRSED
jgi:hypothetical protein